MTLLHGSVQRRVKVRDPTAQVLLLRTGTVLVPTTHTRPVCKVQAADTPPQAPPKVEQRVGVVMPENETVGPPHLQPGTRAWLNACLHWV
eukprot:CAMPEP_0180440504 /NCGR_PEP_ID=MMETSP1036_2-20121128/13145_1 /TAXON_ID=632150 /ORGANISM="Azadinium spinosum, Strain 3D9" /LENGTH=89 /DNA_ID=CAMNT_0022446691 /DNA_START=199 /DNA_END=469 /DNA_ORIENTATION=-